MSCAGHGHTTFTGCARHRVRQSKAGHTWIPESRGSSLAELSKGAADLRVYQYLTVVWPSRCSSFLLSREPEALCRAAFSLCRHREAEHLATEMAFVSDFFCDGAEAQRLFMSLQSEILGCWMWRGHPSSLCSPVCFDWCKASACCSTVVFLQEILPARHGCL